MAKKALTYHLSEPLDGVTTVQLDINNGDGNLTINGQTCGEPVLASGELEYLEKQGEPARLISTSGGKTCYTLKAGKGGQPWIRMPWSACNGATTWLLHLNPNVQFEINAYTAGGNVMLNLVDMNINRIVAETGGGNIEMTLPESVAGLSLIAKTGAGNLVVYVPKNSAARIRASSGLGQVMVDPRFQSIEKNTFQSADYDQAAGKLDLILSSGAGNVSVKERRSI